MEPFTAFLIFVVLVALEFLLSQNWAGVYYRFGIPVFYRRGQLAGTLSTDSLPQTLMDRFTSRPEHPSIRFKALAPGQIAFRETFFENRGGFRYLPVMHSLLRLHPEQNSFHITGYLNWYVLFILVYLVLRSLEDRTFIPVAVLVVFILALSFVAQYAINQRLVKEIQE